MTNAIELKGLRKTFGEKVAVDDLDLVVPRGSLYGFIGPNGAGKTTTIRMIMSIIFPDRGEVTVLDHRSALEAKDRIGYLPEERGVYRKMRVGAFLRYMAGLKGADAPDLTRKVRAWLERVGLGDVEKKRCEELSKGMQQKVQFIASVVHEPELLILDEPFSGLDPINMRLLRDLFVEQHRRGATIIFSTHAMPQAEQLCEHIVMINNGQKVLDDSLSSIRRRFDPKTIVYEPIETGTDGAPVRALPFVDGIGRVNGQFEVRIAEGTDVGLAMAEIARVARPARIELRRPTLEDIFVETVVGSSSSREANALRESLHTAPAAALGATE